MDRMLSEADAFISGGQSEELVNLAETRLGVTCPTSFRKNLLEWGNLSIDGYEDYGLTRNSDFYNANVPNFVWFTLRKRQSVGLPQSLLVLRNDNDEQYFCIDTQAALGDGECGIVVWDNLKRGVAFTQNIRFIDFLAGELEEYLEDEM